MKTSQSNKEEIEKCKDFSYFFEHYCLIQTPEGSRKPNKYEIENAKYLQSLKNMVGEGKLIIKKRKKC